MKSTPLSVKLRELRLAHKYKQVDVAAALGVVRQTYSHYENGDRKPDAEMLYKIAAFYNIPVNDLLQNTVPLDPDIYYDSFAPSDSGINLEDYLIFLKASENQKRLKELRNDEKELLYCYEQLESGDRWMLLEIAKLFHRKK
ncbi:MAG: helix-turn-helix transcriptional regulator [Lachnospiraceae bacterium]|nr:helix-turn-helix transcriptional regulator [Lachnospiraceae bacterium]